VSNANGNGDGRPGAVDVVNRTREELGDVQHRKSISKLSADELAAVREAFRAAMEVSDSRGYGHFASIHGFPDPGYCEHANQLFLPWHRGYLYFFEQALQDLVPGVTLPWWDWTESRDLPGAFTDEQDAGGDPNPLLSAPVVAAGGLRQPDWPERTSRPDERTETWLPGGGLPTADLVADALEGVNYDDFTFRLENLHNAVHVWVGGEMGDQRYAGWDPIFWAHHTMVDRLWAIWQVSHPGDNPRRSHLPKGLSYFKDLTVADTLNVTDLGYDYAMAEVLVHGG
jgi:tyrosinase